MNFSDNFILFLVDWLGPEMIAQIHDDCTKCGGVNLWTPRGHYTFKPDGDGLQVMWLPPTEYVDYHLNVVSVAGEWSYAVFKTKGC